MNSPLRYFSQFTCRRGSRESRSLPLYRGGMAGPLAAMLIPMVTCRSELFENSQNVILAHDEEFFALDLDLGSRISGEQNAVPFLDDERNDLTIL